TRGLDSPRTAPECTREVGPRPVLPAAGDLAGFGVDRDYAAAVERADVGFSCFVQCDIPSDHAARPVPQDAAYVRAPLGPVCEVARIPVRRTAFRPIHVLLRICLVNASHTAGPAHVPMPRDAIDVTVHFRIVELGDCTAPEIVVVVDDPDFRVDL